MKNLKALFLILMVTAVSMTTSCKKSNDDPATKDHTIVFKASTNPQTVVGTAVYQDGNGKSEVFQANASPWASREIVMSASVKSVSLDVTANGMRGNIPFYLNVEIWVDGVKKATGSTTTVDNQGKMIASATYTF